MQSYQTGFNFNRPYGQPLPRPLSAFVDGAFGPFTPIQPVGIDQPREDTGRPDPRRFQYPVGWNLPVGQPGSEGIKLTTFATLRALADMYSVARSCVNHRVQEIVGLGFDIVPTDEAEHAMRGDDKKRADWEKRRQEALEFFAHPDSDRGKYPSYGAWMSGLLEDMFVLDAVAVHLRPPRVKGKGPFNSNLASLDLLDGSTIRPLLDLSGATPQAPDVAYQQYIWGVPRVDLTSVMLGTDMDKITDALVAEYRADQLMYLRYKPRNWTPYGFGPVEQALLPITIGLARQQYQWDFYQDGSIPGQFVVPGSDISTPQQIKQLQDALNAMAGDVGAKHRIIVLPPGSKADPQKPPPLADQFDEWIVSQVTMTFDMTPLDIGVSPRVRAIQSPAESKEISETNSAQGQAQRIEPVTNWLKEVLFDWVLQGVFGQKDMQWSWGVTESGESAQDEIALHVQEVQNALESIDEARVATGKTPWGLPETSIPLVFTPTGPVPLAAAAQQAQAASDQAQQMAALAAKHPENVITGNKPHPGSQPGERGVDEHGEPTTPAHEAAEATAPVNKPASSGKTDTGKKPAAKELADEAAQEKEKQSKALAAELQILQRHLTKGRPLDEFRCDAIPPAALKAAVPDLAKGRVSDAVAAVGAASRAWLAQHRRDNALTELAAKVADAIGRLVYRYRNGDLAYPTAMDQGVKVMASGYEQAMRAGTQHAAQDHNLPALKIGQEADDRGEGQRGFVTRLLTAGQTSDDLDKMASRFDQYGATLTGAYNQAYGQTVEADPDHDYEIIWRLGDTEHCVLCVARADKSFTFDTLPGWPGDGGFGGPVCEGGPNCGCSLDFVEKRLPVSVGTNTQRPDAVDYYAEQNARIGAAREQAKQDREAFLDTIPGDAAARARQRDDVRQQLAEVTNQAIRAAGGYPGVTVEPEDIPAGVVADYLAASQAADLVKAQQAVTEFALFAAVPGCLIDEVCKGWDPMKHPRGPNGRFLSVMHTDEHESHRVTHFEPPVTPALVGRELGHEPHDGHGHHNLPTSEHRQDTEGVAGHHLSSDRLNLPDYAKPVHPGSDGSAPMRIPTAKPPAKPKSLEDLRQEMLQQNRKHRVMSDVKIKQAFDRMDKMAQQAEHEENRKKREKLIIAMVGIAAALALALFGAPVVAALAPIGGVEVIKAVLEHVPDAGRSLAEYKRRV